MKTEFPIRLVVGLGNPGPGYANTRHNFGFMAVERLGAARRLDFHSSRFGRLAGGGRGLGLLQPLTFMNLSGNAVGPYLRWHRLDVRQMLVLVDDLDLPLGKIRVRLNGSAGGHNGLKSLIAVLKTERFARIRLGIGRPPDGVPVVDYVLSPFFPHEREAVERALDLAAAAATMAIDEGVAAAMNHFNGLD